MEMVISISLPGNTGKNSKKFSLPMRKPVNLYIKDFDDNGQTDPLLTYILLEKEIPFANHAEIFKAITKS